MADINNHTPLPEEFKKRSRALFDNAEEFGRFLSSLEEGDAVRALRINTLKVSDAAAKRLISSMGLVPLGYGSGYIFESAAPGSMPMHHAGAFYVQDPDVYKRQPLPRELRLYPPHICRRSGPFGCACSLL